jgi:hypothetical protein
MLAYRLVAHGIGGRTVRELNEGPAANDEGMDIEEFLTWAAYVALEPFPEARIDIHAAENLAQRHGFNSKRRRRPADFFKQWYKPPRPEMTMQQLERAMRAQFVAIGGDAKELLN